MAAGQNTHEITRMNLWITRESAQQALRTSMIREAEVLDKAFQQLEYFAQRLGSIRPTTPFNQISALTAAKARNLAQACYSLILDGLGQESGAIVRVWIESTELLIYIRHDPNRAAQILEGKFPSAGERAKVIGSSTQRLRTALSKTASHLGAFETNSWLHMINERTGQVQTRQAFNREIVQQNLGTTFALLVWTIREAALCLQAVRGSVEAGIVRQMRKLRSEGIALFNADADIATPYEAMTNDEIAGLEREAT